MGTIFKADHETPEAGGPEDAAYAVVESVAGLVPGGAALLRHIIMPPMERRLRDWMEEVGAALRELKDSRGLDLDHLKDDDQFVDAVLAASQVAVRTSQAEKRRALRNAVLNAALPQRPDATMQHMFIGLVDRFTDWHLRILKLFADPRTYLQQHGIAYQVPHIGGSLEKVLLVAFAELKGSADVYNQLWDELNSTGLTDTPSIQGMMTGDGTLAKRTTALGDRFLMFIEAPA